VRFYEQEFRRDKMEDIEVENALTKSRIRRFLILMQTESEALEKRQNSVTRCKHFNELTFRIEEIEKLIAHYLQIFDVKRLKLKKIS